MRLWRIFNETNLAKMYAEQVSPGRNYSVFRKCVSISILDFDLFRGETDE